MNKFLKFFLRGLLVVTPVAIVIWLIVSIFQVFRDMLVGLGLPIYGAFLAPIVALLLIALIGYIGSSLLVRPAAEVIDGALRRIPGISFVYSSVKDVMKAFVGDQRKFSEPVMVKLNESAEVYKLGFMTSRDLVELELEDMVAVYLPHSYAFSGNLFIVPAKNVRAINRPAGQVMKFIVSGGVVQFTEGEEEEPHPDQLT